MPEEVPTVLVVDDVEGVLRVYELTLDDGYDLRTASSGEEALEVVDEDVDVVLLDRRMPGLGGDEVAEAIAGRGLDCVVAGLSAVPAEDDILDLPYDAYLEKPTVGRELEEWVKRLHGRLDYPPAAREFAALVTKLDAVRRSEGGSLVDRSDAVQAAKDRVAELAVEMVERSEMPHPEDLEDGLDPTFVETI